MGVGGDEPCQELSEWLVVVDSDAAFPGVGVFVDVDLGEECLVEQASGVVVGFEVGGVAVACEIKAVGQCLADLLVVGLGGIDLVLDSGELAGDAFLLGLESPVSLRVGRPGADWQG